MSYTPEEENISQEIKDLKQAMHTLNNKIVKIIEVDGYGQSYIDGLFEVQRLILAMRIALRRIE